MIFFKKEEALFSDNKKKKRSRIVILFFERKTPVGEYDKNKNPNQKENHKFKESYYKCENLVTMKLKQCNIAYPLYQSMREREKLVIGLLLLL